MLKEAIEERKGDTAKTEQFETEIDVELDAYIPETYIQDGKQKIDMYKRFSLWRQSKRRMSFKMK